MKRFVALTGLGVMLSGCGNKLNEFEYADITQQANVVLIDECTSVYMNDYCKILKNGDVVYFDTTFESDIIINPEDELDYTMRDISVGVSYDSYVETDTSTYNRMEYMQETTMEIKKSMRKHGLGDNAIYVMQDANGDLVFRMTNGKVDYIYFDTKEAKEIYDNHIAEQE